MVFNIVLMFFFFRGFIRGDDKCNVFSPTLTQEIPGRILTRYLYGIVEAQNLLVCVKQCLRQSICVSFNYDSIGKLCYLSIDDHVNNLHFLWPAPKGFLYFSRSEWPKEIVGPCQGIRCYETDVCVIEPRVSGFDDRHLSCKTIKVSPRRLSTLHAEMDALYDNNPLYDEYFYATELDWYYVSGGNNLYDNEYYYSNDNTIFDYSETYNYYLSEYYYDSAYRCPYSYGCTQCAPTGDVNGSTFIPVGCYHTAASSADVLPAMAAYLYPKNDWSNITKTVTSCADAAIQAGEMYFGVYSYGECRVGNFSEENNDYLAIWADSCYQRCFGGIGGLFATFVYKFVGSS